jgi:hypothetical protein
MKINSILIGKGSGSAGNVTVVQLKGQSILKQKATIVSNPRTSGQISQRNMVTRAVLAWQLFGNVLKQGFTSLLPHSSQYNTYVSVNAAHFKTETFTKETFRLSNLVGSIASKGSLGELQADEMTINSEDLRISFNKNSLLGIAKAGDRIVCIANYETEDTANYAEIDVTVAMLASTVPVGNFELNLGTATGDLVAAFFLVTEDGRKSTTSQWVNIS